MSRLIVLTTLVVLLLILLAPLVEPSLQARFLQISDTQQLQKAWQAATAIGRFHYQTNAQQTTHPTVSLKNAGRQSKTKQFRVEGDIDLQNERMTLQLHTNQGRQGRVTELKVENGQAFGRLHANAEWTPIDQTLDLFAPGGDPMGFLAAAENVQLKRLRDREIQRLGTAEQSPNLPISQSPNTLLEQALPAAYLATLTRYTFDLNGVKYAEYMRGQMEETLRRKGELPYKVNLAPVRAYVDMTGSGEIWVNAEGLPVRQMINIQFLPEQGASEWIEAQITTNFTNWPTTPTAKFSQFRPDPSHLVSNALALVGITPRQINAAATRVSLFLFMAGFAFLLIHYRRSRRMYVGLATAIIGAMVIIPLLDAQQLYAFSARQQAKADQQNVEKTTQTEIQAAQDEQSGRNFNPEYNPLENTTTDLGSNEFVVVQRAARNTQHAFFTTCGTLTDTDCDGDGLSNAAEIYKLGTSAYDIDSDNDLISDKREVEGFLFHGKRWYLDPLNPDSNGDDLPDGIECLGLRDVNPDGTFRANFVAAGCWNTDSTTANSDITPDVFDFDNDGDGVPDGVDDAPFRVVGNPSTGLSDQKLDFNLAFTGTAKPVFVDFAVRPLNADHLWQTNNVLDWPGNDTQGQIQRVHDTTYADLDGHEGIPNAGNGDMMLIPLLEFQITYNAANPSAGLPISGTYNVANIKNYSDLAWLDTAALAQLGISARTGANAQTLLLWAPLNLVYDSVGDTPVAWAARMMYRPVTGVKNLGNDQKVRLLWMVQVLTDHCDVSTGSTSELTSAELVEAWCADHTHWTTAPSVVQTYYDNFYVTSLTAREDHGGQLALLAEPSNVGNANYDDHLWHLADTLQTAWIGAQAKPDGNRFSVADIAGYRTTWGVGDLAQTNITLANELDLAKVAATGSTDMLNSVFPQAAIGISTTLLFAGEQTVRNAALSDAGASLSANRVQLNLAANPLQTTAALRWSPYTYRGAGVWEAASVGDYLDTLAASGRAPTLPPVFSNSQINLLAANEVVSDYELLRAGAVRLAQIYYLSLNLGVTQLVAENGSRVGTATLGSYALGSSEPAVIIAQRLLTGIQAYYADYAVVDALTSTSETITTANALSASFAVSSSALLQAFGNVAQGNTNSALTLALNKLSDYYKVTELPSTPFTNAVSIAAVGWISAVSAIVVKYNDTDLGYGIPLGHVLAVGGTFIYSAYNTISTLATIVAVMQYRAAIAIVEAPGTAAAVTMEAAATAKAIKFTNNAFAVVAFIVTVAIIWTLFGIGKYSNHLQRNAAVFKAVAETVVAAIMLVIALIPVAGWIIVAVIGLISALMMAVCAIYNASNNDDIERGGHVDRFVCGGITGALSSALVYAIYTQYIPVDLADADRLDLVMNLPEPVQKGANAGIIVGNQIDLSATITNTIRENHDIGVGVAEAVGLGTHDLEQMFGNSTFLYTLQTSQTDHHSGLDAGLVDWTVLSQPNEWMKYQAAFTPTHTVHLTTPGLNQSTQLYLTESYRIPALECWGFIIQGCERSDIYDSNHIDLGDDFVFDVLPATFADFLQMSAGSNNGYRQRWDSNLPTLNDGDGDGLLSQASGGADPNDSRWDSDGDGLGDLWELENSFDPATADYDNDGLSDYWEAHYATTPLLADSDNDGLTDNKEFFHPNIRNAYSKDNTAWSGGWTVVYGYNGATRLQTLVNADPNDIDSDDDTILDRQEFIYGYHPGLPSVLNVLSLDANVSATVVAPGATFGYTATVKNELDNRIANGLLQAEFPVDFVQKTQVIGTLRPLQQASLAGALAAPSVEATTASSVTLRAGAIIADVNTGRVLWLHLNESGNPTAFADDALSDNGPHHATCPSTSSGAANPELVEGCPTGNGSFISFDGANDSLTIPHNDELNLDVFTLSLWVNQDVSRAQTLFAKGTTGLNVSVDSSGKVRVGSYLRDCSTGVTFPSSATLPTGSWQNVVVTANGEELALYFNGVRQGATRLQSICANSSPITLGSNGSGNYFDGLLDEVELYTQGKTAVEVASLWQKPVFYVSSYRDTLGATYSRLDESDYKGATISCTANAATDFDCPTETPGIAGDAFVFNQQNGLTVTGSDATDLSAINDTFSLSLWVYPEQGYTPDDAHLNQFGKMILGNDEQGYNKAYPSLYIRNNDLIIRFGHADGNGYCQADANDLFSFDSWQYVSVVFDGANFKVYRDGLLRTTLSGSNCAGKQLYPQRNFYIGNGRSPAIYFTQFETDEDPVNDEGFLWSADTRRDNGFGARQLVWMSGWHDMDSHDTLTINQWADVIDTDLSYSMCNADENVVGDGCEGENEYFTLLDDSRVRTVNFYDALGTITDERWHNAHGDGSGDARTWAGYLTYKLYNDGFKGNLDEIKIYRTVLDANAIRAAYASSIRSLELTFDEAPGRDIFTDSSGNGYDGACATTSCPDSGIPGRDNQSARFDGGVADDDGNDGVADYITLGSAQTLGIKDGSFTVLAWVKPDTISGLDTVLGADAGATNNGLGLAINNGKPYFTFNNNTTASTTTLNTNQWTHLAWRYDKNAQEQAIFVNGVLDVAQSGKPPMTGATLLRVGRSRSSNYFDGLIDHLVIIKAALPPAEIQAIMDEAPLLNLHLDEDLATTTFTNDSPIGLSPTCASTSSAPVEPAETCPIAGAKGQVREAPIFDGNDLLTTDITGKVSNARKISIGLWVKPAQQKNSAQFLFKSGPVNLFLQPNSSTLAVETGYYHYCGFDAIADFTAALLTNQWNHVLVTLNEIPGSHDTYPSVKVAVYINGVYVTGGNKAIACPTISTITLGQNFEGSLDEVVFYDSVLSAETVAALYEYQSTWFDLTYQQLVTVDADAPLVDVALGSAYLAYQPYWLTINAIDATSAVASVTTRLTRPNGTVVNGVATQSDGSGNSGAWLYEFTPTAAGPYTLEATATDGVGNRSVTSATFAVDSALPAITLASEQLTTTLQTRQTSDGIVLDLDGEATDADGIANSGVNTATVAIRVLDWQGAEVQSQRLVDLNMNADGTAGAWNSAYPFNVSGYGRYTVESSIADQVGNILTNTLGIVTVDDYGPTGDIALTSRVISEAVGTLEGVITDIPYATAGKLLHLHFEENAGANGFSDSARNHWSATYPSTGSEAGAENPACPELVEGHNGDAVSFDGSNDRLTIANGVKMETGALTLLAWVKPSWNAGTKSYNPTILGMGDSTSSGYRWQLADNYGSMILHNGSISASVPVNLTANTWHHLALVHDGTTWTGYVDGIPAGVITQSVGSLAGLDLHIGAATSSTGFFQGQLDEIAIYNRALSGEELYDIANPLPTAISSAEIRFRHAKDGDQGEHKGDWLPLTFAEPVEANFVTWDYPLPSGLEGPYKIDLRATDALGNSSYIPNVWSGEVDTLAPRLQFDYALTGNGYAQVACSVEDYNLVSAGVTCPLIELTAVAEDDAWFTDLFGVYTKTVALEAKRQTVPVSNTSVRTFSACDEVGHCVSQTITPSIGSNVITILNPGGATTYTTTAPLTLNGYAASVNGIFGVKVTVNGEVIYAKNYTVAIPQTTWSTTWTPRAGTYTVEATINNGLNQQFSDPVDTVLTFVAPNLTVNNTVKPTSKLRAGDAVTYTVVFGNTGDADATNVVISDTLPTGVSGSNLSATIDLAAGQRVTYTIPATVLAGNYFTATNTAAISHTWQKESASVDFTRCDRLLVTNAKDSGAGSLRQAISDACTDDAVIRFAGNYNIYLNSTLAINKKLTIDGAGRSVTISGDSGNNGSSNVQIFNIGASGAVTLTRLSLVDGTASRGGAIANAGTLTVIDSSFWRNHGGSSPGGGAIYSNNALTVIGSTFRNNTSTRGGALFVEGVAELRNSTLNTNSANEGSGIHNRGVLTMTNVTGSNGGALHNWTGKVYLRNSILANNGLKDCTNEGVIAENSNNLIETGNCGATLTADPILGDLTAFPSTGSGNVQWVLPLLPGSPALNTGDNVTCETSDQRGQPRHGICDIGAFESQGFTFTLTSGDNQIGQIGESFAQPLAFSVQALANAEPVNGGYVFLSAPAAGASLAVSNTVGLVDLTGNVTLPITANQTVGSYIVTATIGAEQESFALNLTNISIDLALSQQATPTAVVGGDWITYTLAYSNVGTTNATSVTITNTLPGGVTVQQVATSGMTVTRSSNAASELFRIDNLAGGEGGVITITARLSDTIIPGAILTNTATIAWPRFEANLSNNRAVLIRIIPCQPAIVVTNGNDRGSGSLRQALANLCDGGEITFAADTTIYLDSVLALGKTLTIDGRDHTVTVSGDSGNDGDRDVPVFNISASGVVTLSNLSVVSGTATLGGGIYNAGSLTLDHLTIAGHQASDSGAALYNVGTVAIDASTLAGNRATNNGAIYNGGSLTVENSTFAANNSRRGGGLYNTSSYTATVTNSTFAHNVTQEGGGIHNRGLLTVTNSTFAGNSGYGSSLHNWNGTLHLTNSLLTGSCINQGTLATTINNFVADGSCSATYRGTASLSALSNYGGATTTFALLPGSAAIDRGNAAACPATDQRGLNRNGVCDIGAFESQGFTMHYAGGSDQNADAGATFSKSLAITITANAANEPVAGGSVLLTAPDNGASLSPATMTSGTTANGATVTVTANRVVGSYVVTATANGVTATAPITFTLTNNACSGATVTNANDSGAGSLRQAIDTVCPDGVITFDNDYTIHLSSTLALSRAVTIDGAGHQIIVSGDTNGDGTRNVQPFSISSSGVVTLTHLSVMGGTATNGSAIANDGTLLLDAVTVANNYAATGNSANAGTLYNTGTLTVKNSTFARNESYRGGGLYHNSGTATVVNSTFADNVAPEGGGIYNRSALTVTNSTFSNNSSTSGESYVNRGALVLVNTLHNGKSMTISNCQGNTPTVRLNNRSNDATCGVDAISFTLKVMVLGDYGGSATGAETAPQTAAIQAGSSAINAGNSIYCPSQDQRGKPRLGLCDIGAVEWQGYRLAITDGDNQRTGLNNAFATPLQVRVDAVESFDSVPSNQTIYFSAPETGASLNGATFNATTNSSKIGSVTVTANGVNGSYGVTATASSVITPVVFSLTNDCTGAVVTNANDAGYGSLRQALTDICDGGTITFADDYAIYLDSTLVVSKTLTIDGGNHAITLSGDSDNDADRDVRVFAITASGVVTLSHLSVVSGTVDAEQGAGIWNEGVLTLLHSTVADNRVTGVGAGAGLANNGTLTISNSSLLNNRALDSSDGGGLTNSGDVTIVNSTFSGNQTATDGGAIHNSGTLTISNSTLSANGADGRGGGLYNGGTLALRNTIIANSTSGSDCVDNGSLTVNTSNLIEDASCSPALSGDPRLSDLGDYTLPELVEGSAPATFSLLPGSLALDAGDATSCATTDQRGASRVGVCDIGATESQGFTMMLSASDQQSANHDANFAQPLQVSLIASDTNLILSNEVITFTAPISGASLTDDKFTLVTDASGNVAAAVTANSTSGSYAVVATAFGFTTPVTFTLTNLDCYTQLVTNANDNGPGSLRRAVTDACDSGLITFADDYTIYLNSTITTSKNITISGADHAIIISGDSDNNGNNDVRPFQIETGGAVIMFDLDIVNGSAAGFNLAGTGGAILNQGSLTLEGMTLSNNSSRNEGGAITNYGTLALNDSTLQNNRTNNYGGGLYNATGATLTIFNSEVISNSSQHGAGVFSEGAFTIEKSLFAENGASTGNGMGGGIVSFGAITVTESTIISNTAAMGGGLLVSGGSAVISHTIFADNLATDEGGAISSDSSLTLINSTINRNRVESVNPDPLDYVQGGGGISSIGRDTLINSTISGNASTIDGVGANGGGLLHAGAPGELAPEESTLTLVNTIIADNTAGGDCLVIDDAPVADLGHNLIGDGVAVGSGGCVGHATTFSGEPWLAPWGYYGGESPTNALLPNSPAINGGDDAYCPTVDQRGMARVDVCDIGAFESQGFTLTVSGGDNQSTQINQPFAEPLQVVVSANDPNVAIGADQIVSFSAPSSDASLSSSSFTATTDVAGVASVLVDANDVVGSYGVTATVPSGLNEANFALRNRPSNVAPTLVSLPGYTISETHVLSFTVVATDLDDDLLTFQLVDAPAGAAIDANTGHFIWTPTFDQGPGLYPMTVIVTDDDTPALSSSALFTVTVLDLPLTYDQAVTTDEGQALALELLVTAANDPLTYSYTEPSHGVLSGDAPALTYTPNDHYVGSDSFTFFISDGILTSTVATVAITVNPVNVTPIADAQGISTDEETPLAITLTATDGDGDPITYTVTTGVLYGELGGIAPNLIYTPSVDFAGEDRFRFVADDGLLTSDEVTVTITINAVDDVPVAQEQRLSTPEETALPITLRGSDVDSDRLTYRLVATPDHGALGGVEPNLIYTPTADFSGVDTLLFNIDDGSNFSAVASVTISVTAVNDPPRAYSDTVTTLEDEPVVSWLSADDPEEDALSYTVVTPPRHGTIGGIAPTLIYTPDGDFHGADLFTFAASDGQTSSSATIAITVEPRNDAPTAADQSLISNEDEWIDITLTGADVDNDDLTFAVIDAPEHGALGGIAPNLVYTPELDYQGSDSFTFVTNDGEADSPVATVAITLTAVNDQPGAASQSIDTDEDQPVVITLGNSDAEDAALTFMLSAPAHGVLAGIAPDLVYTPSINFHGTDVFTFTVNDGTADSTAAAITITVAAINDPPLAAAQSVTTSEESALAITLTGTDDDNDALTYVVVTQPLSGTLGGIAPNLVYTPAVDFAGSDLFTFLVNDGVADSVVVPITITVTPINDTPIAANGTVTTTEDSAVAVTLGVLDADHDPLDYTLATPPSQGTLTGELPDVTYTPNANYHGNDAFTFTVSDGINPIVTGTITVTVAAVNDHPLAETQLVALSEEQAISLTLTGSDDDGDALTYTILTQPVNGALGGVAPNLVYTPTVDFNGADAFTFGVSDGISDSLPATVTLTIAPVNDAPTTAGQSVSTAEDRAVAITLTATDTDTDPLNYILLTQPAQGVLGGIAPDPSVPSGLRLVYTPNANFAGNDAFQFSVTDGMTETAAMTVTLAITPVADAPVVDSQRLATEQGAPLTITLTASDIDSTVLTYMVSSAPGHGSVGVMSPAPEGSALGQSLVYTPDGAYLGNDAFSFTVSDGELAATATVSITVTPRNQAPLAYSNTVTTTADSVVNITLTGSDPDGDPLTYATLEQPVHGRLSGVLPNLVYAPADGFSGFDRFTFQVSDGSSQAAAAISITVQLVETPLPGSTGSPTPTPTATATGTPGSTISPTATPTATPTTTATATDGAAPMVTATAVATLTSTPTATEVVAPTATPTATIVDAPTATPTTTATATVESPLTPTTTATDPDAPTATLTATPTATPTATATATVESDLTPTVTATLITAPISTATATPTATLVAAPTATATETDAPTATATATATTPTATEIAPTATSTSVTTTTVTATPTTTGTALPTNTPSSTPTAVMTVPPLPTMPPTATPTPSSISSPIATPTATLTASVIATPTVTPTPTVLAVATELSPTSTALPTNTATVEAALPTPTATLRPSQPVALDLSITLGIWGIKPHCTTRTQLKVPRTTAVAFCYTVHNQTAVTQTLHTLTDSQWGLLLDKAPLALGPGQSYQHIISRTVTVGSGHIASWLAEAQMQLEARRAIRASKAGTTLLTMRIWLATINRWHEGEQSMNTALVEVATDADDQDGDGIPDNLEQAEDMDGDNLPNFLDLDADGDGAPDALEGIVDSDNDSHPDYLDPDTGPPHPTGVHQIYLPLITR